MVRKSFLVLGLVASMLAGCTTVSVVPGQSVAAAPASAEQAALREASDRFGDLAVSRGWITKTSGLFDLARMLSEGQAGEAVVTEAGYADLIGIGVRPSEEIMRALASDALDARAALSGVTGLAVAMAAGTAGESAARADVMAYERVLVNAQKCRRTFQSAAAEAGTVPPAMTEAAFAALDAEIDRARSVADQIAANYSGRNGVTVS